MIKKWNLLNVASAAAAFHFCFTIFSSFFFVMVIIFIESLLFLLSPAAAASQQWALLFLLCYSTTTTILMSSLCQYTIDGKKESCFLTQNSPVFLLGCCYYSLRCIHAAHHDDRCWRKGDKPLRKNIRPFHNLRNMTDGNDYGGELPQHIVEGKRRNQPRLGCRRRNGKKCMKICGRCFSSNSPFFVLLLFLHCDPKMTPNLWRKKLKVVELGPACFGWWVQAEHTDSGYWNCRSCCSPAGENEAITRRMENELD